MAADKTQNIVVNYKFNTAEVAKGTADLNRANDASNKLQQSAEKAGQSGAKMGTNFTRSIGDMTQSLVRLKTQIEVSTNPARTAKLSKEYQVLKTQLDAATKSAFGLTNALNQQGTAAQGLSKVFGGLYGAVQAVVGAAVIRQVANLTLEMARLSGNAEGVKRAFERAFPNSFSLMKELKERTHGAVNELELMQKTLQATNLGVSVKQLPLLFEFAAARAQQTGESVDYLVDSIVRGIGRKSVLVLDNLGLSATRLREKFNGAGLAGQSVGDVTKAVAEIAREELDKMGGYVDTAATHVAQLEAAWVELRITLAKRIDSSGIINFFKEALGGAEAALKTQKEINDERIKEKAAIEFQSLREHQLAEERVIAGRKVTQTNEQLINQVQMEIRERMKLIEQGKVDLLILKQKYDQHNNTGKLTGQAVNDQLKARQGIAQQGLELQRNVKYYEETIKLLRQYFKELQDGNVKEIETISTLREKLKDINTEREEATSIGDTARLNQLDREAKRLEDRILRIADNVAWQKKWNIGLSETDKWLKSNEENLALESKAIESLTDAFGGDGKVKLPEIDTDQLAADLEEVKETAEAFSLGNEFVIRLRLGIRGEGGETSEIQAFVNDQLKKLGNTIISGTEANFHSIIDSEVDMYRQRLDAAESFYAAQQELAGDNEHAKTLLRVKERQETDRLRNEIARKEKQAARSHILLNTAIGVAKALATYPWPYSLIPAGIVAAQGAFQLAIASRQPTNFAKGVLNLQGPGTSTSDSIPANLSRGESVMTAWEGRVAGDVLKDIRAKRLDNNKLRELKQGRGPIAAEVDTQGIIKAIKSQKPPDVIKISKIVYESQQYTDEYKKRVRSRSMGGI
jgi:hypothetical protein